MQPQNKSIYKFIIAFLNVFSYLLSQLPPRVLKIFNLIL